jgi:hypothetical protein
MEHKLFSSMLIDVTASTTQYTAETVADPYFMAVLMLWEYFLHQTTILDCPLDVGTRHLLRLPTRI